MALQRTIAPSFKDFFLLIMLILLILLIIIIVKKIITVTVIKIKKYPLALTLVRI